MYGVYDLNVGELLDHASYGSENAVHWLTEIFTSVSGEHNETGAFRPIELRMAEVFSYCGFEGVNGGISGNVDSLRILALFDQVISCGLGRREIVF